MKFIFSAAFCLQLAFSFAQSGNFFLSHYSPGKEKLNNICFQARQHSNGIMYFATRSGILEFDGKSWDLINGNGAVYTLVISADGNIFWGGAYGYGVVSGQESNLPEMKILSQGIKDIFQSLEFQNKIYFLNEENIFVFDPATSESLAINATEETGAFSGIFQVGDDILVSGSKNIVYKVSGGKLGPSLFSDATITQIVFASSFKDQTLVASGNNEIFVAQAGKPIRRIQVEDQQFLNEGVVTSGSWVNDDLVVLGTLRGGLIFLNLTNGKTHEIINYATGLPDNEIFTIATDQTQCIWAAHEYGFTRVAPYLPFRSFSHYPGVEGNLLCAVSFKNSVYVGTSLGLYRLEKDEVFGERSYYVTATSDRKKTKMVSKDPVVTAPDKRKGIFRFFRKRETEKTTSSAPTAKEERVGRPGKKILKTERVLVSSSYRFKKVKNIEAKITRLHAFNNKLVACGLGGTYEIDGLTGTLLLADPARYIFGTEHNELFISTYSDEVKTLRFNGTSWVKTDLLKNLNDQVTYIFKGNSGETWLCALDKIYRIETRENELSDLKVIEIENPNYDEFVGSMVEEKIILANSNGFYHFNEATNSFARPDSLVKDKFINYFSGAEGIWYRDVHGWNIVGADKSSNLGLLNLFQNIRFINPDTKTENLWVITDNNQLYKYFSDRVNLYNKGFPLVLKSVKNGDLKTGGGKKLKIEQENSRLTFEVVQPDYLAPEAVEYRYHITGLEQEWTDWSQTNNVIEIPYLPAGDYSLEVEARDIFGNISPMETIALDVRPPYWKTTWFYALEVLLFSAFVILSFRLSTRYRIISRLLMLLTIIMLIQFVETIIGDTLTTKTSPVIDFLIQVIIAMMILPIEGYLRELMLRSLDTSHRFYRFIAPKAPAQRDPGGNVP
jgi:ligand-binding sensor domain-containing protein